MQLIFPFLEPCLKVNPFIIISLAIQALYYWEMNQRESLVSLAPFITDKIMIPKFSTSKPGMDSLNVGMAASIIFSEFLRKSVSTPDL